MKTGTSEPYDTIGLIGETWNYGFTPQLVFGTWFGNADNTPMANISSYYVSANTTRDFMVAYHENLPVETFAQPDGLARASVCIPSGLRPTPNCPQTTPNDLFAAHALPGKDDDWWQKERVDRRTGQPANDSTPQRFIEERVTLKLPDNVSGFERDDALQWARFFNAKEDEENEQATPGAPQPEAVAITAPANAVPVTGVVAISGSATSPDFQSYRLEFRSVALQNDWLLIAHTTTPVQGGTLAQWNTVALAPGLYDVRLIVVDSRRGEIMTQVEVLVVDELPTPEAAVTPATGAGERDRGPPNGNGRGRGRGD
jgi:hypothetical protein